jgi:hypothetical protein
MPDEAGDVLQRLVAVHEQGSDDCPPPSVRPQPGSDAGGLGGLLHHLRDRLAQHQPTGRRDEVEPFAGSERTSVCHQQLLPDRP